MSQGEKRHSQWTLDSLYTHILLILDERSKRNSERFAAAEKAVSAALASADKLVSQAEAYNSNWREAANEWRAMTSEREKKFITREENNACIAGLEKEIKAVIDRIDKAETRIDIREGRAVGQHSMWVYACALIAFIGGALGILVIVMNMMTSGPK